MQITFLGTSASEGYPNAFCACDNCEAARKLGGPSLRKRSAALVDEELLIDMGPDLMAAAQQHNVSLAKIRYCLQTHEHSDHLDPSHFHSRSEYCGVMDARLLRYYASDGAIEKIEQALGHPVRHVLAVGATGNGAAEEEAMRKAVEKLSLQIHPIAPFEQLTFGPYSVLSVAATHAPDLTAMLYVIERDERVLFYCTDTADLGEETWAALRAQRQQSGRQYNVVVMDHTFGLKGRSTGHMNVEQFTEQMQAMVDADLLAEDVRVLATHIGHHSNPPHPELVNIAARHGYEIAHDGLVIQV